MAASLWTLIDLFIYGESYLLAVTERSENQIYFKVLRH